MNLSTSQRALWAIALGSILTLGASLPAAARDDARGRTDEERLREPGARKEKAQAGSQERGNQPRQFQRELVRPAAAQQRELREAPRQQQGAPRRDVRVDAAQARQRSEQARMLQARDAQSRSEERSSQARQHALRVEQARVDDRARIEQGRAAQARRERAVAAPYRAGDVRQAQRRDDAIRVQQQADSRRSMARTQERDWPQRRDDVRRGDGSRHDGDARQREQYIRDDRRRAERYRQEQVQRYQIATQRARLLEQQRRMAQYRYEQHYLQRLRQQQASWNAHRYDPWQDQYYLTPANYRYAYGGGYRQTNRYGADLMRQAVDYGYQEGVRAGRADREDGWRADYRGNYGYQDASYGYNGYYVDQDVYNHYFRQGFQRGYEDGYSTRYRHGRRSNGGEYAILGTVLAVILGLQLID